MAVDEVEVYLVRNLDRLDLIVDCVVNVLPQSYFYKSSLNDPEIASARRERDSYARMLNSTAYRYDRAVKRKHQVSVDKYQDLLKQVADANKEDFVSAVKEWPDEMKALCLYNLIRYYKLTKHMRSFND